MKGHAAEETMIKGKRMKEIEKRKSERETGNIEEIKNVGIQKSMNRKIRMTKRSRGKERKMKRREGGRQRRKRRRRKGK